MMLRRAGDRATARSLASARSTLHPRAKSALYSQFGLPAERLCMPDYRVKRSASTESLLEIVESLADAYAGATHPATRRRILDAATRGQRLLLGYSWYRDDVTNGGHRQYFWNYTGNLWPEALGATRVLRLPEGTVLGNAVALFPRQHPGLTVRERRKQLAAIDAAKFEGLDDQFYALPGGDEKVRRYIDKHPDEFFLATRSK
jgi:hypothetical protein